MFSSTMLRRQEHTAFTDRQRRTDSQNWTWALNEITANANLSLEARSALRILQRVTWPQKVSPNDNVCEKQAGARKAQKDSASNAISSLHILPLYTLTGAASFSHLMSPFRNLWEPEGLELIQGTE